MMGTRFEITSLTSTAGVLTKQIKLGDDGRLISDGSACVMGSGNARRIRFDGIAAFANHIGGLASDEAIALGSLGGDLPDKVEVTTAKKLAEMNGAAPAHVIARTAAHIAYAAKQPALALLDYDSKGQPDAVAGRVKGSCSTPLAI